MSKVTDLKNKNVIRIGELQVIFDICKEEYNKWINLNKDINNLKSKGKHLVTHKIGSKSISHIQYIEVKKINTLKNEVRKTYVKSVIFIVLYLEALIYDFGATKLGDTYMRKHMEKVSLYSKWYIIPKLATNTEIKTDSNKFSFLKKIISERNRIIHNKSKKLETILLSNPNEELKLRQCFECLEYLISELIRVEPEFTPIINNLEEVRELISKKD